MPSLQQTRNNFSKPTPNPTRQFYYTYVKKYDIPIINNIIKISPMNHSKIWLPHDSALLQLHLHRCINSWSKISHLLAVEFQVLNRSPKNCRERFNNHLNPEISRAQWSSLQQSRLLSLHDEIGNRWAQISRHLPGRTDNAVKNKLYSKYRRALRNINILLKEREEIKYKEIAITFVYKIMNIIEKKYKNQAENASDVLKTAIAIKNEIIAFENIDLDNSEYQQQFTGKLKELILKMQWLNTNVKRKSIRKTIRKNSEENLMQIVMEKEPLQSGQEQYRHNLHTADCQEQKEREIGQGKLVPCLGLPYSFEKISENLPMIWSGLCYYEEDNFWEVEDDSYAF